MVAQLGLDEEAAERIGEPIVTQKRFIPISAPVLVGNEKQYVIDCLDSTWISSRGKYIEQFEHAFASFCGVKHAVSCSNGTTALHLALLALGVVAGDEVIVPTLTFVATANAVAYCGARPIFVDAEPRTWNIDPALIEAKITSRTKGIIVVHLYGHSVDMDTVLAVARRHGLFVLEDAAEAHGALYKGKRVGSMGDISTFSFFGNKVLTTGEGGMVVTNDERMARQAHLLKEQGMDPDRRYWHPVIGYNYRMTNIAAAIGLAQTEKSEWHLERRRKVATWYRDKLKGVSGIVLQAEEEWAQHVYQFFTVVLTDDIPLSREDVLAYMLRRGVEGRPVVYPSHILPPYADLWRGESFPVAEKIAHRGINLPTSADLTREEVNYVSDCLLECIQGGYNQTVQLNIAGTSAGRS
jgi:perosamine synthetase